MASEEWRAEPVPTDIAEALARVRSGAGVVYFPSVGSTNDMAARLAERGVPHLTAAVAEQQTAGRGRLGRAWFSPPGAGLYLSVVLRPDRITELKTGPGPAGALITIAAGVAFAEAVRVCTHLPVMIKWPNDLVIERRKLGGILTEASGTGPLEYVVVGFGLNMRSAAYPPEIADRATSVEAELGRPIDRGTVLAQCLAAVEQWTDALAAGKADAVLERWRSLAPSAHGAAVEWSGPAGPLRGITDGIDRHGALLVRTDDGVERIIAGEIKWLS